MGPFYIIKKRDYAFVLADAVIVCAGLVAARMLIAHALGAASVREPVGVIITLYCMAYLFSNYIFQVYRIIWRYSNRNDFYTLFMGLFTAFVCTLIMTGVFSAGNMLMPLFAFFLIAFAATVYRAVLPGLYQTLKRRDRRMNDLSGIFAGKERPLEEPRILIAGAGEAGRMILAEYNRIGMAKSIIGFVDDSVEKIGTLLNGKRVFDAIARIGSVIRQQRITELIIAMPSVDQARIYRIISLVRSAQPEIVIRNLPHVMRPFDKSLTPELREIGIADLIGREEAMIDIPAMESHVRGKRILITGAGGSIGSELCRQLLKFRVSRLIAVGRGEHAVYQLIKQLRVFCQYLDYQPECVYVIANVTDYARMKTVFDEHRPDIVFHAAAHKHVDLMEHNVAEAFNNNVKGSMNMLELSASCGATEFVLISTDKAVNPTSIMGATKRVAELLALYYHENRGLKVSIVRFGNVIASRDSVIPLFREQIQKGGPVTVTHPEMKRYFMSIPEAALLVINAIAYSRGGEIFVLDMGEQYRIDDIARNLIRLYGLVPDRDIMIQYVGIRPGEKLYEELFYDYTGLDKTANNNIYVLKNNLTPYSREKMATLLHDGFDRMQSCSTEQIRALIRELVPEYQGGATGPNPA